MKPQLDKRIAGYSALAAAMLTGAQGKAEILKYTSGAVLNTNGQIQGLDFDQVGGDGNDLRFLCYSDAFTKKFEVQNLDFPDSGAFLGLLSGPYVLPFALNYSSSIRTNSVAWNAGAIGVGMLNYRCFSTAITYSYGFWGNKSNKYMGVRFDISGQTHYGWVKMSCNGTSLTIHEYAYESVANTGIDAPLPVKLSLFTAESVKNAIQVKWTTQSEEDNLGFVLERRLDSETEWTTIASYQTHDELNGQENSTNQTDYQFNDSDVYAGHTYHYRLSDVDVNGNSNFRNEIQVDATNLVAPSETELVSAYPNPFNPGTTIQYKLELDDFVTLSVVDITGRTVRTLVKENQQAGQYSFAWDGNDNNGNSSPSGIYMLVLRSGQVTRTLKITRLR